MTRTVNANEHATKSTSIAGDAFLTSGRRRKAASDIC